MTTAAQKAAGWLGPHTVAPAEADRAILQAVDMLLETAAEQARVTVVCGDERIDLTPALRQAMHGLIHTLASGAAVDITPHSALLTTQQAALLLSISRPTLNRLLDRGVIPTIRVGGDHPGAHRRVRFTDVLAYQQHRKGAGLARVGELIALTEELDLYNDD